jgi:hypothetical protein
MPLLILILFYSSLSLSRVYCFVFIFRKIKERERESSIGRSLDLAGDNGFVRVVLYEKSIIIRERKCKAASCVLYQWRINNSMGFPSLFFISFFYKFLKS